MSAVSVQGMECSLTGWPSTSQFDDFVWTGVGEIDPLENLVQLDSTDDSDSKSNSSVMVSTEPSESLQTSDKMHGSSYHHASPTRCESTSRTDSPNLSHDDSLATCQWESMNASDLASVLDSTFPSESVSSISLSEDGYALYNDGLLLQPEQILNGEVDIFMADSMCGDTAMMAAAAPNNVGLAPKNSVRGDCASLISNHEQEILTDCNWDAVRDMDHIEDNVNSRLSSFGEILDEIPVQGTVRPSLPSLLDCGLQKFGLSQTLNGKSEGHEERVDATSNHPVSLTAMTGTRNVGTMNHCLSTDTKSQLTVSKHACPKPDMKLPWHMPQPVSNVCGSLNGGKHLHPYTSNVEEGNIVTMNPQSKLADSARLSSQIKTDRAQASRARRLAVSKRRAEGRAKKYPLHRLIRMSSPSTGPRDSVSQNLATLVPMLHTPVSMMSQNPTSLPGVESLQMNQAKHQNSTLLPIVVSGSPVTLVQAPTSYTFGCTQQEPNFTYQHQLFKSQCEDQCLSSESSVVQHPHSQPMQSKIPVVGCISSLTAVKGKDNSFVGECTEATLLKQLEDTIAKLNEQTRICIRDALYRLARSANERQNEAESATINKLGSDNLFSRISCKGAVETQTNPIDRWVVNLLFCKQPPVSKSKFQLPSPMSIEATRQPIFQSPYANGNMQYRYSCGRFVTPQEMSLCT